MIAMKREIAGTGNSMFRVTPWSECLGRLQDLAGTPDKSLYRRTVCPVQKRRDKRPVNGFPLTFLLRKTGHARECVQSPLVVLH
jgi:hypothetical protein